MRATILSAEKKILPFPNEEGTDVDTLMIEVKVQYQKDDGTPYMTQNYARTPASFDLENITAEFDTIAQSMQNDITDAVENQDKNEASAVADEIINKLLNQN